MSDPVSFPVDHPCRGATPDAVDHSSLSIDTDVPDDDKTRADRREVNQAAYATALRMAPGESERNRFQMPAIRISDGSQCVLVVIQRTSSWSLYGADGVHVSDNSMTILARLILTRTETDSTV